MLKRQEHRAAAHEGRNREQEELRREIDDVRLRLECVDSCFNRTDDEALIDSLIYQRHGLIAHYSYLLRRLKAQEEADAQKSGAETPYQGRVTAG